MTLAVFRILFVIVAYVGLQSPQAKLSLSGVVTDAATGSPIRGAVVTLTSKTPPVLTSTLSGEDGGFRVDELPPGHFYVRVSKQGFADATYGSRWYGEPAQAVLVSFDRPAQMVAVALRRSAALFGEVRDGRGELAVGTTVTAFRVTQLGSSRHAERIKAVRTDGRGRYRLFGLESGSFVLSVLSASRAAPTSLSDQQIDRMLQALHQGRRNLLPQNESPERSTANAAELAPVFFPGGSAAGPVGVFDLRLGGETRADLFVPTSWAGSISGTVAGLAAGEHARVSLEPRGMFDPALPDLQARGTSTVEDGSFAFRTLSPGTYTVTVRAEATPGSGARGRWGKAVVEVGHGAPTSITIVLSDGLTVSGRIAIADRPPASAVLPSLALQLVAHGVRTSRTSLPDMRAVTNSDGRFEFRDVPPGSYRVLVSGEPQGWSVESVACVGVDALDVPCDLSRIGDGELVVTITTSRAGVEGRLDAGEAFVPDALMMVVFPVNESEWTGDSRRIRVARLSADGKFSFELPPGQYHLAVVTSTTVLEAISLDMLTRLRAVSIPVVVRRGEMVRQDFRVGR